MGEPWKNSISPQYVTDLGTAIQGAYSAFDVAAFRSRVLDTVWKDRELMARLRHISHVLHDLLPGEFKTAVTALRRAAPRLDSYGFQNMVFPDFVGTYGLENWDTSMDALEQFTKQTSSEFAVRPFIVRDQARMLAQMLEWTGAESPDVRRLASEGSRPRLPWGIALKALQADPTPLLPILEELKLDESEYVRRSVANSLNEIAKDHPEVVIVLLRRWNAHDTREMRWTTKHALRTLLKRGHPGALDLLGYSPNPAIEVLDMRVRPAVVPAGGTIAISFDVVSTGCADQKLMIDFVVHLMRASGRQTPKVFKLSRKTIGPGDVLHIAKDFSFRPVSSRRYYPGEHAVTPKINGKEFERARFALAAA
jgi:3-methyladenine DNA glycosylase AlkC